MPRRGFTVSEVETAIQTGTWEKTGQERLECRVDFPFDREWNGKHYTTKQVRPIFVDEEREIVVITVYVYYF